MLVEIIVAGFFGALLFGLLIVYMSGFNNPSVAENIVSFETEMPGWVKDNISAEGQNLIMMSAINNAGNPEAIWLSDNGYTYCGSVHYYTFVFAKPGKGFACS